MRGCQKKVVFVKNTGSDFFEEAYFVLKEEEKLGEISHATMVEEAKRIIDESLGKRKRRFFIFRFKTLFVFLLGFVLSFVLTFTLF
jgi:hypothetical protein